MSVRRSRIRVLTPPTDDVSPEPFLSHGSYSGPPRDLTQRLASTVTTSHDLMMVEYASAEEDWLAKRDSEACGYTAEESQFAEANPRPLLRDFMKLQWQYSLDVRGMRL